MSSTIGFFVIFLARIIAFPGLFLTDQRPVNKWLTDLKCSFFLTNEIAFISYCIVSIHVEMSRPISIDAD